MISWGIAEKLGLEPELSKERVEIVTASGIERVPLVEIPMIGLAGQTATKVKAVVHDLPQKSYVDGLLGLSFLRNFNLTLNFEDGTLELKY